MSRQELDIYREAAIKEGYTPEQVESFLLQRGLIKPTEKLNVPKRINEVMRRKMPVEASVEGGKAKTALSLGTGILAGMAATPFTSPAGGVLAGSAASALTDQLVDKFLGKPTSYPLSETLGIVEPGKELSGSPLINLAAGTLEGTIVNETAGRLLGVPLKFAGNAFSNLIKEADRAADPGSWSKLVPFKKTPRIPFLVNKAQANIANLRDKAINLFTAPQFLQSKGKGSLSGPLSEFDPTFAQYAENPHHLVEGIENIFARKQKEAAVANSSAVGLKKLEERVSDLVGRKVNLSDSDIIAKRIQMVSETNFNNLTDTINETKEALKLVGKGTPAETKLKDQLNELVEAYTLYLPAGTKQFSKLNQLNQHDLTLKLAEAAQQGIVNPTRSQLPQIRYAYAPSPILNRIVDDAEEMNKFLTSGEIKIGGKGGYKAVGSKDDLRGYQFMRLLSENTDTSTGLTNISAVVDAWNKYKNSGAGRQLYNAKQRADLDQIINNETLLKYLQHVGIGDKTPGASRYLTLRLGTGIASLSSGVMSSMLGGKTSGLGTAGAIVGGALGLNQIGKLMVNPDTARLMIAMTKGGPLNMSPKIAGRIIGRALRNQPFMIEIKDPNTGETTYIDGKIDNLGKFKADLPENEERYQIK